MIDIDKRRVNYGKGFETGEFIYEKAYRIGKNEFMSSIEYAIGGRCYIS